MRGEWEDALERWLAAGLLDGEAAARIRAYEGERAPARGLRWPVWLALTLGVILLGSGVLLFVSAHWDEISPGARMTLAVLMVAAFHGTGAAMAQRFPALSVAMHTLGTLSLGAAIALMGQIFQLSEHWPTAVLLWAAGALSGWLLLRHWTQATLCAILFPYWLGAEFEVRYPSDYWVPVSVGIAGLSLAYLAARRSPKDSSLRRALGWLGGIAVIPAIAIVAAEHCSHCGPGDTSIVGWAVAVAGPMGVAVWLRGRDAVWNAVAGFWILVLSVIHAGSGTDVLMYLWCAIGAAALAAWGIRDRRKERVNLGIAGFAITVLAFYFSSVMDKLGRSMSLIGLGLLFLGGGWLLEKTRRRLMAQLREGA